MKKERKGYLYSTTLIQTVSSLLLSQLFNTKMGNYSESVEQVLKWSVPPSPHNSHDYESKNRMLFIHVREQQNPWQTSKLIKDQPLF